MATSVPEPISIPTSAAAGTGRYMIPSASDGSNEIRAGALYPAFGVLLSPMIAGAAMSFSSVPVIANAQRLRKVPI